MALLLSGRNCFDHEEADLVLRNMDAAVEGDAPPLSRRLCRDRARLLLAGDAPPATYQRAELVVSCPTPIPLLVAGFHLSMRESAPAMTGG
jgi:hypothetical protein